MSARWESLIPEALHGAVREAPRPIADVRKAWDKPG